MLAYSLQFASIKGNDYGLRGVKYSYLNEWTIEKSCDRYTKYVYTHKKFDTKEDCIKAMLIMQKGLKDRDINREYWKKIYVEF